MNQRVEGKSLRKIVMTGLAALALAGAAEGVAPAQAMPLVAPSLLVDAAGPGFEAAHYTGYRHWHRRGYRRPVPCRGVRTHLSKRYC